MGTALNRDAIAEMMSPDKEIGQIFVRNMVKAGFEEEAAKAVLNQADTMSLSVEDARSFQENFVEENGKSNKDKQGAFMHAHATKMTVDSYLPVLADRADNADNHTKLQLLEDTVRLMHAHGFSGKEIANVFNDMLKISKSSTPHPTEGLSPKGIQLARNLVLAAEIPAHNGDQTLRNNAIKLAIREIAESKDFEAKSKSTMVDEMDSSCVVARIHNAGANKFDRSVEDIIFRVTGEKVKISTNTAPRSWDYDTDGKNNAEAFAMMAKMATTTKGALDDLKRHLDHLLAEDGPLPEKYRRRVSQMSRDVGHVLNQLSPVYERSREVVDQLAKCSDIKKREEIYQASYSHEFDGLYRKLGSIYDDVDRGKLGQRGLDFYKDTLANLDKLRTSLAKYNTPKKDNTYNAFLMDESFRTIERNGFALDKGQTRNNDNVYQKMMQNLFKSDEFWKLGILGQTDREHIEQKENGFLDLSSDEQWSHMQHIMDFAKANGNRKKLLKILVEANPLESAGNGYPEQERAYIDRMLLLALFPKKFEESIISDAKKLAPERQTFFAEICGYRDVRNMALYEDPKNLAKHAERFNESAGRSGKRNLETRQARIDNLFKNEWDTLHIMRPASDAERNGGSFTRLEAMEQYREFVQRALKAGVAVQIMIGGGQSLNRFGGDVDMVRRIAAQELKVHFAEKLKENGKLDDGDWRMMKTATSILYTEQGRTKRYASATSDQVTDDLTGKATNILQDVLDMCGKVDYVFIDRKKDFSVAMDALQVRVRKNAIRDYEAFANVKAVDADGKNTGQLALDGFADKAGSPNMVGLMNNGARAAAGKSDGSKKGISTLRAIGKDQWLYTMQSYHAGFYGAGTAMQTFHENLQAGYIQTKDIADLMENPDWDEAIFSRNLIDAGRFNATHLFTELSEGERTWNFDSAVEVGSQVVVKNDTLYFNGEDIEGLEDVTQEELYLCRIYFDRLKFLALTEAAASDFSKEMKKDLKTLIQEFRPEDGGLEIGLGENTKKKWPSIEDVTLANHRKNAAGFAVLYQMESDIEAMVQSGVSMKDIYKYYGDGNEKDGEAALRAASAALRAGTLPHQEIKVMGKETYGIRNRTRVDMDEQITIAQQLNLGPQPEGLSLHR